MSLDRTRSPQAETAKRGGTPAPTARSLGRAWGRLETTPAARRARRERRRAEEELRRAHGETEQLLASISWILIAVDEKNRVTRWNAAAEQAFGRPAAEVLGRPLMRSAIRWEWRRVVEVIRQSRGRARAVRLDDVPYTRPDGKEGVLSLTVSPIAGHRAPMPLLILGSDITERRLLQMQLAQAQKLESIGQLAAGVAHEINTPIQFVGDNTRFLQDAFASLVQLLDAQRELGAPGVPDGAARVAAAEEAADLDYLRDEIPRAVAQTLEGVSHVASIVRALRAFAHPDRGEPVPADLNQALQSTLTVARNEIKYVADVETDLAEIPPVLCHPGDLNQVFLNLIVNAVHAIADVVGGSGTRGRIRVRTAREGDSVVVSIADTGTGIPADVQPRIFDPFFTTKPIGRGTGQGLAIAHAVVVDKHGGTLTFETEAGRGTTFHVRVPIDGPRNVAGEEAV